MNSTSEEYYVLTSDNVPNGPYALEQLRHMWRLGQINKRTMFSEAGGTEWLPLSALTELFAVPEPPRSASATIVAQPKAKPDRLIEKIVVAILIAVAIIAVFHFAAQNMSDVQQANEELENALRRSAR